MYILEYGQDRTNEPAYAQAVVLEACHERLNDTHFYTSWPVNAKESLLRCWIKETSERKNPVGVIM